MKTEFDSAALVSQSSIYPARYGGRVPKKVKMIKTVTTDRIMGVAVGKFLVCEIGYTYPCYVNSHGAVSAIFAQGDQLGLKPDEFDVAEWHEKNPPQQEGMESTGMPSRECMEATPNVSAVAKMHGEPSPVFETSEAEELQKSGSADTLPGT